MRSTVSVDEALMAEAMRLVGGRSRREVIEKALRALIRLQQQRALLALEGTVAWEGDLEAWRSARFALPNNLTKEVC